MQHERCGLPNRGELPGASRYGERMSFVSSAPRILIIEDEAMVRKVFERTLSQDGYHVTGVASAKQALCAAENEAFDVVIVDMGLPDGDGPEVLRQIVAEVPYTKALAVSGEMGGPMSHLAIQAGAARTIQKPITPGGLRSVVYQLIDQECTWRPASHRRAEGKN